MAHDPLTVLDGPDSKETKMTKFEAIANELDKEIKSDTFSVNVKSENRAVITFEFINDFATVITVDGSGNIISKF